MGDRQFVIRHVVTAPSNKIVSQLELHTETTIQKLKKQRLKRNKPKQRKRSDNSGRVQGPAVPEQDFGIDRS